MKKSFRSVSPAQTKKIGRELAGTLKHGDVVALYGDLGAGKTTFVKGVAKGLGISESAVSSPTFVLIHEYEGRLKVFHIDWYRLKRLGGEDEELAEECFRDGVTLVEWPERGRDTLPRKRIEVRLKRLGPTTRRIEIARRGGVR